ncbi:MAG: cobalt-precorrin-5B (C(1))-methyltransferase [Dehalococcoidales bacterium]|nr:cobalt-precorrin-5B (C(1))-methyltransferase [Dehalococcoidales bacterium]MDZ4230212.1 cobalt-precorrin-5B (C(1))-methyltransferase [Dehalococcoidales bacterium]
MPGKQKNQSLRYGYTTGACAAAAAKAATISLLEQCRVEQVRIELPGGKQADFQIKDCSFDPERATCSVIKDAGDDPDITDGAEIFATVRLKEASGLEICGGEGVGTVTKPGLEVPVGSPAINPMPKRMIASAVISSAEGRMNGRGLQVVISVPEGKKLARRTLNSRLGIIGGISILGTSGIVIPYSISAYTACISQGLKVAAACGLNTAVLTTGRRSEKFAQAELKLPEESYIQAGDFIGFSLKECARLGLTDVIVWGMIGKISKLANGHMYTNVSDSLVDIGSMVKVAEECETPQETMKVLEKAITANHFRKMMPPEYMERFCDELCRLASVKCREHVAGKLNTECIMTDPNGTILGRAKIAG